MKLTDKLKKRREAREEFAKKHFFKRDCRFHPLPDLGKISDCKLSCSELLASVKAEV